MNSLTRHEKIARHAIRRARERYEVTAETVTEVRRAIRRARKAMLRREAGHLVDYRGDAMRICIETRTRERWRVTVDDETYLVIYEVPTEQVVTFLPREAKP